MDTDAGEQGLLKFTVTTTAISAATAASVPFTIAGLDSEDTVSADPAGNTLTPVAGTSVTLTQFDHWTKTSGGNWTTAASWTTWNSAHAVPTGTIDADFDTSGTRSASRLRIPLTRCS